MNILFGHIISLLTSYEEKAGGKQKGHRSTFDFFSFQEFLKT